MMKQLEKLVDVAIVVLEMYAVKLKNEMEGNVAAAPKKTRAPKAVPLEDAALTAPKAEEKPAEKEADLGLGLNEETAPAAPKELTEAESKARMEEVTTQYIKLTKNDKPADGKTLAIKMMQTDARFKVGKLGGLTHAQRLVWIAEMEKGIEAHK